MHLFLYRNSDHTNLFGLGSCLAKAEKSKNKRIILVETHQQPSTSKCVERVTGPQLRVENMSLLMEFCFKQGTPGNAYGRECVLLKMENLKKMLLVNRKSLCAVRYMFKSMKCEVYAPIEAHPYPRKRQSGRLLFYRSCQNSTQSIRISINYALLDFFCKLNFIHMPIQRFHVESYTTQERINQFVSLFGECVKELVWKSGDIKRALDFISACANKLSYLECDINLLESPDFPHLRLNQFKSIKVKANSDQIISLLLQQDIKHVDLCELSAPDEDLLLKTLFRPTLSIVPQKSLESASLRLQVCQANELLAKITAIKRFAPNLHQVEFVRNIAGIEFDSDLSQFLFMEIDQVHSAIELSQVKGIELSVRYLYSLQPEECFSFRANASLAVICNLERAEMNWKAPRSSSGKQMMRRRKTIAFNEPSRTFRGFLQQFVEQMEKDYHGAECY